MKLEELYYNLNTKPVNVDGFDVKKWKEKNPIDYFKYIYLINKVPFGHETNYFEAIYKVTRLYNPNVVYKYYSLSNDKALNNKKFSALEDGKIYLSDLKALNDPFEGKAFYYNPKELQGIESLKRYNGKLIDDFSSMVRLTSFTENDENCMSMWAHYSNNHQGYCVSYDVEKNDALRSSLMQVQYTDRTLDITSLMKNYAIGLEEAIKEGGERADIIVSPLIVYIALLMFNVKGVSWEYEREYRCVSPNNSEGMPFINAKVKTIYVGKDCSVENYTRLREIALKLSTELYKMRFEECLGENRFIAERIF